MNARLFKSFMKYASVILFLAFLATFLSAFGAAYFANSAAQSFATVHPDSGLSWYVPVALIARAFVVGFEYSAMYLLASAALFRADQLLEAAE